MDQDTDLLSEVLGIDTSEIPAAIEPVHPFTAVGEPITLYEGPATLLCRVDKNTSFDDPTTISVEVDGQLTFALLPHRDFVFQCTGEDERISSSVFPPSEHKLGLMLPEQSSLLPIIPIHSSLVPPYNLKAIVNGEPNPLISEDILQVNFYLINFPGDYGNTAIRYDNSIAFNRIHLQMDDEWVIDIDSRQDINLVWKQAVAQRSFILTHVGRIKRQDGEPFNFTRADSKLNSLFWFLSFLCGRPVGVSPVFAFAQATKPLLLFKRPTITYSAKDTIYWLLSGMNDDLNTLYGDFSRTMGSPLWKEILPQLVSSYGSVSEGYIESRLSTACSALETMAWMRLVHENEWLTIDGFEKLTSSDKLRLLLQFCAIDVKIPRSLEELTNEASQMKFECPEIIQWVRNRVVHPDRKNQLTNQLKIEACHAAIWFLELTLLNLFKYKGRYKNRISQEIELVPWADQEAADSAQVESSAHE